MENPFENGHIKNYLLLYASIVVIMVLFFVATTLFHDVEKVDTKKFRNEKNATLLANEAKEKEQQEDTTRNRFKLLDNAY